MGVLAVHRPPGGSGRRVTSATSPSYYRAAEPEPPNAAVTDALTGSTQAPPAGAGPADPSRERERAPSRPHDRPGPLQQINDTTDILRRPGPKEVARRIQAAVRGTDTAYRYGGEEVVLPPGARPRRCAWPTGSPEIAASRSRWTEASPSRSGGVARVAEMSWSGARPTRRLPGQDRREEPVVLFHEKKDRR